MKIKREYLVAERILIGNIYEVPFGAWYRILVGYHGFNRYINRAYRCAWIKVGFFIAK